MLNGEEYFKAHLPSERLLRFNAKEIRAVVIREYMEASKVKRAVCFSCGNASKALKDAGIDTIDISPKGELLANKWFTPAEVKRVFSDEFDATSGHLPLHLMIKIGERFKSVLKDLHGDQYVPTGSGETIICLKLAYPHIHFIAVYNLDNATSFDEEAPLNDFVHQICGTMKIPL